MVDIRRRRAFRIILAVVCIVVCVGAVLVIAVLLSNSRVIRFAVDQSFQITDESAISFAEKALSEAGLSDLGLTLERIDYPEKVLRNELRPNRRIVPWISTLHPGIGYTVYVEQQGDSVTCTVSRNK